MSTAALNAAKAELLKAKAKKESATARTAIAVAKEQELQLAGIQEEHAREKAGDYYQRIYRFHEAVTPSTAAKCRTQLEEWSRLDPKCDIEIEFLSPGGDVTTGLALFDAIQELRRKGHKIVTSTVGMAASMAGILLQAGDERIMSAESWLLIHQASFGSAGATYEVEDKVEWIKRIQDRILDIFATRAKDSGAKGALSKAQIKRRWHRKDWWVSSDEALKYGFIDSVR